MSEFIPRPEHPQPQFERKNWRNLNGEWEFEFDFGKSGIDRKMFESGEFSKKIIVPFCPESKLSGIGYIDFIPAVWYRKKISLSAENLKNDIILHFGAADYKSVIYINGKEVVMHIGGYSSFKADITPYVTMGENTIVVYCEDDCRNGLQPKGKQSSAYHSNGCDYTRTTGIWQTVWLEFVPKSHIVSVKYYPDIANSRLNIQAVLKGNGTFTANAYFDGKLCGSADTVKTVMSGDTVNLSVELTELHLWKLGKGGLYDLILTFNEDTVYSYFGMREVCLSGMKFMLNGKSVFQRTVLDQGFYPDGIYTAKDEDELVRDIELSMAMGFNGARLHQKVFESRYLYHCDMLGYMVWGEHANWGLDLSNPLTLHTFLTEWIEIVERDFNHPSIIGWCPFNETWDYEGRKQIDETLQIVYKATKALDSTRPCIDTSGNYHSGATDIYDIHNYKQDVELFASCYDEFANEGKLIELDNSERQSYDHKKKLPVFISEYGGIKWDIDKTNTDSWGYGEAPKTKKEFIERYRGLTNALLRNKNIIGFCYTQLYDVEQETNGLYTYDRAAKFDTKIFYEINTAIAEIEK